MGWIGTARETPGTKSGDAVRSLELPTRLSARGLSPVNAIVEALSALECRIRCVILLDRDAHVEFDFAMPGQAAIRARGRVVSRTQTGPRFIYRIVLDRMNGRETDELARALAILHRKPLPARPLAQTGTIPTTDGLVRSSIRASAEFPIVYRTAHEDGRLATASDVSTGGMLMTSNDALLNGMPLELRFTLPSGVLHIYPEETAVLDLRDRAIRNSVPSALRKPFTEMTIRARVVTHKPMPGGGCTYGLAFSDLDEADRDQIARYVHAIQLAKRR